MFQILCLFLVSISAVNQHHKAPALLQYNKQAPGWLDSDQNTSTSSTPIDLPSVNLPTEETIWEHGDSGIRVTWDGVEGTLIKISLLKNGSLVAEVIGWCDNDESEALDSSVQASWGSGSGFQVQIEDNLGNTLTSETFRIMAPINISEPRITTVWSHSERDISIAWSGSPGNTVDIVLFDGDYQMATLASNIPNTGTYTYLNAISSSWGTGDNYSIRIIDDIGNEYNSRHFTINAINVTSPASGTVWSDQNPDLNVTWEGGARVVRISLYRGSTKIKDLTEWIDNTDEFEVGSLLSLNLEAGSNYKIEVRDDQGDQGFSENITITYSQNTREGALDLSGNTISTNLAPNETKFFNIDLSTGYYSINITSSENNCELVFERNNGTPIKTITQSEEGIYLRYARNLRIINQSENSTNLNISIRPVEKIFGWKHGMILMPASLCIAGGKALWDMGLGYDYALTNHISFGTHFSWASVPNKKIDRTLGRIIPNICFSTSDRRGIHNGGLYAGIGYSLNRGSSFDTEEVTQEVSQDGYIYILGWRQNNLPDEMDTDTNESMGRSFFASYCPANKVFTIGLYSALLFGNDNFE